MKNILLLGFLLLATGAFAQKKSNLSKGVAVKGYDVVAYFYGEPLEGNKTFQSDFEGITYHFSSAKNKASFDANPVSFIPQYGGWCAYAMGTSGDLVNINPRTFEIRDGKLYLFYNKNATNTLDSWLKEEPSILIPVADRNWEQ